MEPRYYTPTIEEFHVGFEFEWKLKKLGCYTETSAWALKWQKDVVSLSHFSDHDNSPEFPNIRSGFCSHRVKCLDKEDIESMGFKRLRHKNGFYDCYGLKVDDFHNIEIQFLEEQSKIRVLKESSNYFQEFPTYLFDGEIKNKSELKKLLKQLNIYE